jgi:hypothetical protein
MPEWIDLAGQKVGELTVVRYAGWRKWVCRCSCGREVEKWGWALRAARTTVCSRTFHAKRSYKLHPVEYNAWRHAKKKGNLIEEWNDSFDAFFAAVGVKPDPKARLLRVNEDEPLGPGNFAWVGGKTTS